MSYYTALLLVQCVGIAAEVDMNRRMVFHFANGYGASVVSHAHSYGGEEGLCEIAVLRDDKLCYTTPLTNDVLGWQTDDDVAKVLAAIAALPKC